YQLYLLEQTLERQGSQSFNARKNNLLNAFERNFKDYDKTVDEKVFEKLIEIYASKTPDRFLPDGFPKTNFDTLTREIYSNSALTEMESLKKLLEGSSEDVIKNMSQDKGYALVKNMAQVFQEKVLPKYEEIDSEIAALQRTYMKAIKELSTPADRIFPDANSTLRVTYGKVKGYSPADAVYYHPVTYLDGVMEKYVPGDYEFDVPQKLIDLHRNKEYGPYAENGKLPVNFIATNHTTGGNSGSPAIDARGNLIGLNFDRVWEGTMSDIYYDPEICRNIMVDARYILFIIDKYAGAKHLIDEMKLISTKKKQKK
ncbi:MAG: S46 family peptidase, partial [Flavobacterium sp.]